jgi:hypothetical protein
LLGTSVIFKNVISKKAEDMKKKENDPNVIAPGKGLEKTDKIEKALKKEADFPGGSENVAGADGTNKKGEDKIGSKPMETDKLNFGDKK